MLWIPDNPFTTSEAQLHGLPRHALRALVDAGQVRRVFHGVYAPSTLPDTTELRSRCLSLVTRPDQVVVDRTAAALHGIDVLRPHERDDPPLDLVTLPDGTPTRRPGVLGGQRDLRREDICVVDGIRVTTPARTAADLACLHGRHRALGVLDVFMREAGVSRAELTAITHRFQGRRGVTQLRELLPLANPLAESMMESWLRLEIHDAGLSAPQPQFIVLHRGVEKYRIDLAWPALRVGVEYLGEEFHDENRKEADEDRVAWLRQRRGWIIIEVTKDDVGPDPERDWLAEARAAIAERSPHGRKRRYARGERVRP